jgi:hypothetical protein
MSNKPRKPNVPLKPISGKEMREIVKNRKAFVPSDPTTIFDELGQYVSAHQGKDKNAILDDETRKLFDQALGALSLDNHYLLSIATSKDYRSLSIELANQLIKEHSCTSASEKALVHILVNAYIRSLEYARMLSSNTGPGKSITTEMNGLYSALSKEIDRANRQFITALTTLKQLKSPSLTVNVKTNAAFIAQNQQVNAVKKEPNHEIN